MEEAGGKLGVSGPRKEGVVSNHRDQPHPGETASIAFGQTAWPGLSDHVPLVYFRRKNTPNMQRYMYTPSQRSDQGVLINTYITRC
jgi:hypothetical protein